MKKKVSIKDIAMECNVSTATVSRAWNDSKEISEETRNYILKVCREKGYKPSSIARSLILDKTHMIGLVILDITNPYFANLSKGVSSFLNEIGYGVILCNTNRKAANEKMYLDFLAQKRVDGIIIIPLNTKKEAYEHLIMQGMPLVLVDNYVNDLDVSFVSNDFYAGARKIIMHMVNQGYKRIGTIMGSENSWASNDRLRAYKDVLKENGLELDKSLILYSNAMFIDGYELAEKLISQNVDSIFAVNDTVALGVMKYCYSKGIRIPEDIGLAGCDDIEQSSMLPVPLTTIHLKKYSLGYKAAELLINEINTPKSAKQKVILQPELIIRKTCGE